jgi:hypothetical protein
MDSRSVSYAFDSNGRPSSALNATTGSMALYHHNGSRYGLLPGQSAGGVDSKMNGLHGPKHKRGDVDSECKHPHCSDDDLAYVSAVNRFTGTRLKDLQGEISALCKDQHGCPICKRNRRNAFPSTVI